MGYRPVTDFQDQIVARQARELAELVGRVSGVTCGRLEWTHRSSPALVAGERRLRSGHCVFGDGTSAPPAEPHVLRYADCGSCIGDSHSAHNNRWCAFREFPYGAIYIA